MYEPCVSGELTIHVLSVLVIVLMVLSATLWACLDRCKRSLKPSKAKLELLRDQLFELRQQKGVLMAELRSYQARDNDAA